MALGDGTHRADGGSGGLVGSALLERVAEDARLSRSFFIYMATAGVLAAVALLTSSVPILIGAMVIAPALPPVAVVAFALVAGRPRLALSGPLGAFAGLAVSTGAAVLTTVLLNATGVLTPDAKLLEKPLLEERVNPGWYSVAAALAAGVAGAVAQASQRRDELVGVVAALALVPAAAAGGIALLSRDPAQGVGGFALLGINVAAIVATGAATLLVLRPGRRGSGGSGGCWARGRAAPPRSHGERPRLQRPAATTGG